MADITKTTLDVYLQEQWSSAASIIYASLTIIEPKMNHRWEPELGVGRGDLIRVPEFTESTSADKRSNFGVGAPLTLTAVTEGSKNIPVDQMAYKAFQIPVEMSLQTMAIYIPLLTEDIGRAIAQQIDTELAADNSNGFDSFTTVGSDGEVISDDVILEAEAILNTNSAPMEGRYVFVSPNTRADLLQIDVLRNQLYASATGNLDGKKGQGYFGTIYTLDFYMTNKLEAGINGTKNFVGQTEAIAFVGQSSVKVVKDLEISEGLFDIAAGWKAYGFLKMKTNFGRELDAR